MIEEPVGHLRRCPNCEVASLNELDVGAWVLCSNCVSQEKKRIAIDDFEILATAWRCALEALEIAFPGFRAIYHGVNNTSHNVTIAINLFDMKFFAENGTVPCLFDDTQNLWFKPLGSLTRLIEKLEGESTEGLPQANREIAIASVDRLAEIRRLKQKVNRLITDRLFPGAINDNDLIREVME